MSDRDFELRLTERRPISEPIYGIWVDEGLDGMGSWMIDTCDLNDDDHPAVFYSREKADWTCKQENDNGNKCRVVELRAVPEQGKVWSEIRSVLDSESSLIKTIVNADKYEVHSSALDALARSIDDRLSQSQRTAVKP